MNAITRSQAIARLTAPGQAYELEAVDVGGRIIRSFRNAPRSLRELFQATATDLPFIAYENERMTFAEAWRGACCIGHALVHRCGVRPGDRVAISMRNYPEWVLAFTAITSIGAIVVAMNAHWQAEEMAFGLADCGAKALFVDRERIERLTRVTTDRDLTVIAVRAAPVPDGLLRLSDLLDAPEDATMPEAVIAPDDPATIFYTSGSTGHPKGVVSTHRNLIAALLSWELDRRIGEAVAGIEAAPPAEQPGTLLAVPLFHVTGSHAVLLSCYRTQRRLVSMRRWEPEAAAALIERERLTSFVAPAAMTGDLVRIGRTGRFDLSSLVAVGGGGAPRAPEQVRQIGPSLGQALPNTGWGMTETNAIGTGIGGEDYLARPASSGRCSLVLDIKIVDDSGVSLPPGQSGELMVRGASVFAGYWNRPDVNAEVFVDGWFRTGDVAQLDDEGFLFIVDRIKDIIIRGGENIGCGQVEAALLMHPDVHEAAVYGLPDERLGEIVAATVHGAPELDVGALREFLGLRLARFEVPEVIAVSPTPLPRTPSGKIYKREIRAGALQAAGGAR